MAARYVRIGQYPDYRDEIRGTLAEILASTANPGTYAAPEDVAGCTLEMGADGLWTGASVGTLTQVQADSLVASGALANLATGATYRDTSGTQYTYSAGVGWVVAPTFNFRRDPRQTNTVANTPTISAVFNSGSTAVANPRKLNFADGSLTSHVLFNGLPLVRGASFPDNTYWQNYNIHQLDTGVQSTDKFANVTVISFITDSLFIESATLNGQNTLRVCVDDEPLIPFADQNFGIPGLVSYGGTGNGTLSGLVGTYASVPETITVTWTSATAFNVSGSVTGAMGSGTVGTLFSHAKVAFTAIVGGVAWTTGATASFVMVANTPNNYVRTLLAFPSRATRKINLVFNGLARWWDDGAIVVSKDSFIRPVKCRKSVFFGDSYLGGYTVTNGPSVVDHYGVQLAWQLGILDGYQSHAIGGTGYTTTHDVLPFCTRASYMMAQGNFDDAYVFLGINDGTYVSMDVIAALSLIKSKASNVFAFSRFNPRPGAVATMPARDSLFLADAASAGAIGIGVQWFSGTGYYGKTTGDGNSDSCIGSDGTHPQTYGQEHITKTARSLILASESAGFSSVNGWSPT